LVANKWFAWASMPTELLNVLNRRRATVECRGETWESAPLANAADASHLTGCSFDAPAAGDWLKSLGETPQEDLFSEALREELARRGPRPAHAPVIEQALAALQQTLAAEQEELDVARADLARREGALAAQEEALRAKRGLDEKHRPPHWLTNLDGTINVAIVGNSGVGKSLLINCLRKLQRTSPGWAPVGVNETTMEPTMYCYSGAPEVRLWDLPGAGTVNFPSDTYVKEMGLRFFDRVLIVTAGRFTEMELCIQQELDRFGIPYVMVRNKVDLDVWNNQIDNRQSELATLEDIRRNLKESHGLDSIYLISSRDGASAYDMPALLSDIFPSLKNQLSAEAKPFRPGAAGWDDAWAMPEAHSEVLSFMQGLWTDHNHIHYLVHGCEVHVSHGTSATIVSLSEDGGRLWWGQDKRWWIDKDSMCEARKIQSRTLRWSPSSLEDKPLVWQWSD